jgi:hypothetical protein
MAEGWAAKGLPGPSTNSENEMFGNRDHRKAFVKLSKKLKKSEDRCKWLHREATRLTDEAKASGVLDKELIHNAMHEFLQERLRCTRMRDACIELAKAQASSNGKTETQINWIISQELAQDPMPYNEAKIIEDIGLLEELRWAEDVSELRELDRRVTAMAKRVTS